MDEETRDSESRDWLFFPPFFLPQGLLRITFLLNTGVEDGCFKVLKGSWALFTDFHTFSQTGTPGKKKRYLTVFEPEMH